MVFLALTYFISLLFCACIDDFMSNVYLLNVVTFDALSVYMYLPCRCMRWNTINECMRSEPEEEEEERKKIEPRHCHIWRKAAIRFLCQSS